MRVELVELLQARQVCHPSRVKRIESDCDGTLQIGLTGYPWWLDPPPSADEVASARLGFEGIVGGSFDLALFESDSFDEDLESFDARRLADLDWGKGPNHQIFSRAPLPNPFNIFQVLHDYLLSVECPFGPAHFLNMGDSRSLARFHEIASSESFLVCSGPTGVCQVVCDAIGNDGVAFNVIEHGGSWENLIWVRLKNGGLICRSAFADFEA